MVKKTFKRPLIIAEVSVNHLGMEKIALAILKRCKEMGVDYIKLKVKDVEKYYDKGQKKYKGYDFLTYRKSFELSPEGFETINKWCKKNKLSWYSTVHDMKGLKFVSGFNVPFYKIASSDALSLDFVKDVVSFMKKEKRKKKLIISCGGADIKHIEKIVNLIPKNINLYLLHCVSIYPTPVEKTNIGFIATLKDRFESKNIHIGYSGHEEGWVPSLFATQLGAEMIERHISLTRNYQIHHIQASLTTDEFQSMIQDIDKVISIMSTEFSAYFDEELDFLKEKKYI